MLQVEKNEHNLKPFKIVFGYHPVREKEGGIFH